MLFLKELKTQPETQGIPILLLTLKAKWSDLTQSWFHKSQLAAAIIVNPLQPTMLAVQIAKVLGGDLTKTFKGGTRHAIYPWNQSKIENLKSLRPPNLSLGSI
ncbi:hypothetical protein QUA82_21880 [Microcoleus sp. F8-D3]